MNWSTMSKPYPPLCRSEDPHQPVVYFTLYRPKVKARYLVRTLDLPADMRWLIGWTGINVENNISSHQRIYDELLLDLEREARDPYFQHLVVLENEIPRLLITVGLETNPYRGISRRKDNYVWYLRGDTSVPPARLALSVGVALDCCFEFKGVDRIFLLLDRHQKQYHPLALMTGFEQLKLPADQMPAESRCYHYHRDFNAR